MATVTAHPALDYLVDPLTDCFTAESAKRLLKLKADRRLQARVSYLADRCSAGKLSRRERSEYENYVSFSTFIALLKSKARRHVHQVSGEG
jgi:hypothetical protein